MKFSANSFRLSYKTIVQSLRKQLDCEVRTQICLHSSSNFSNFPDSTEIRSLIFESFFLKTNLRLLRTLVGLATHSSADNVAYFLIDQVSGDSMNLTINRRKLKFLASR